LGIFNREWREAAANPKFGRVTLHRGTQALVGSGGSSVDPDAKIGRGNILAGGVSTLKGSFATTRFVEFLRFGLDAP
jgi:hypothetical protein